MENVLTLDKLREMKALLDAAPPMPPPLRFVRNNLLTIGPFEDWSQVRSPGRAARRRRQGHKQRIRYYYKPDPNLWKLPDGTVVGHSETIARLENELRARP